MAMSLLLVVLVALASPFVAQASRASSDFDFFMFTTTWAGTFCDHEFGRHCKHVVGLRNLTIHGLWPNYDSGKYPQFCDKRKFDPDKVADLQDRLNAEWPDLLSKGGLWSHEFEKHGTCSASVLPTEHDYFGAALSLNERLDLTSALFRAGIQPSSTQAYPTKDIVKAVKSVIGDDVDPELNCADGNLQEIRVCFTKTFQARNCDSSASSASSRRALRSAPSDASCGVNVYLPPFNSK
ncbi:ribonuclease [Pycnococcus provasolii]|uniref:Ribonuclease n=2 Tax=Pycnococcus provasolii TaxID=41880 RepID=A0A830HFQ4_9CHLO|nr:ribonuclease [Pycnococcus provasolii]|mmetsp:Transcript_6740/g.15376  ORF Transcript_6740/g.15376 Transcript_6740/m.15376 type:complete len:238 (+) Transcript_6740:17-730(+)